MGKATVIKGSADTPKKIARKEAKFSPPYSMRVSIDAEKLDLGTVRLSSIVTKPTLTRMIVLGYSGGAPNGLLRLRSLTPWATLSTMEFLLKEKAGAFNLQLVVDLYKCWQDKKDEERNPSGSFLELSVATEKEEQRLIIPVLVEFKEDLPQIHEKPVLELSNSEMDLGEAPLAEERSYSAPSKQHVILRNSGDAVLVEEVHCETEWVHVEPLRLRLQPGEEQHLSVWASPVNIYTGVHTASIRFINSERTLSARVKVTASGPVPQLEENRISLPDIPLGQEEYIHWLKIRNIGIGALTVQAPLLENRLERRVYEIQRGAEDGEPAWVEIPIKIPLPKEQSQGPTPTHPRSLPRGESKEGKTHTVELTLNTNSQLTNLRAIPLHLSYRFALPPSAAEEPAPAEQPAPPSIIEEAPPLPIQPTIEVFELDFGQMKPKEHKMLPLKIENRGQETLVIEKISVHDRWIRLNVPRDKQNKQAFSGIDVIVAPHKSKAKKGERVSGKITIYSNDPKHPAKDVSVRLQITE
jgi:hypothetical protein